MMRPSDYPPPFAASEFVAEPTDPADERIEVGVLIVGAGPAGLACAIRLGQLVEEPPELAERLGDVPVAVLEKGKQPGSHIFSGAVVNPRVCERLFRGRSASRTCRSTAKSKPRASTSCAPRQPCGSRLRRR